MWQVEQTDKFKEQVAELRKTYPRIDDAVDGVLWALKRDPERPNVLFPDFGGRGIKIDAWPNVPKAVVYFKIDGHKVIVYAIYDTAPNDTPAM